MGRKPKVKPEEIIEGEFLDEEGNDVTEEVEEYQEEEEADPLAELRELSIAQANVLAKLTKAVVQNQKYISRHAKEITRLKADFKILLEEK